MKLEQILDVGTDNPIVARLGPGLHDIIQMAQIDDQDRKLIVGISLEIMKNLVEAEKSIKPLVEELTRLDHALLNNGVKTQAQGRVIEHPSVLRLSDARIFLKYSKQALQKLATFFELIFKCEFSGPHFHRIRDKAFVVFGEDHTVTKLLVEDQDWIKELLMLRNEDEHPKSVKPFLVGYDITPLEDGRFFIKPPRFFNESPVLNRIEVFSENLLTFCEEMIAYSLETFFPAMVKVYTIPESERDLECPVRFKLGFSEGVKF